MLTPRHACLVDGSIYIFRAWFALPDRWHSPSGQPLNAVVGYLRSLIGILEAWPWPQRCAVAFDESLFSGFRHQLDPEYKANRALPDEALAFQLNACRRLTESLGVPVFGGPDYEADDYLASLAVSCRRAGDPVCVVTRDKDLVQLLDTGDLWWDFAGDVLLDADAVALRYGVRPEQMADYLALVGDTSDNIPGVPGIGPRTAAALLQHHRDLDMLGAQLPAVASLPIRGATRIAERLQAHWPRVLLNRQLTRLADDCIDPHAPPNFTLGRSAVDRFSTELDELGLSGVLARPLQKLERAAQ